jgi:hypothetical protein
MIAAAVQFYDVVTWVHITAVVIAFGPTFAYGAFATIAEREGGAAFPAVGRAILLWSRTGTNIGMIFILLSGIYLAADRWEFSDFFVSWGFIAIIVMFGLVHGYFNPRTREQIDLAERDLAQPGGELSDEFTSISPQVAKVGSFAGVLVILTIYIMTAKPFL